MDKVWILILALALALALTACGTPGDFCDIAKPKIYASDAVHDYMFEHDPEHDRQHVYENEYGEAFCGWKPVQ